MKTIPQITIAEPRIRIPAWRRASPKKWNTRPLKMSPKAWPQKRMMSPRRGDPVLGDREPADPGGGGTRGGLGGHHLITRISGWVASRVWVNT